MFIKRKGGRKKRICRQLAVQIVLSRLVPSYSNNSIEDRSIRPTLMKRHRPKLIFYISTVLLLVN